MNKKKSGSLFWGLILILFGVLFLLDNFYIMDFGEFIVTYWPLILIAIGLKILYDNKYRESGEKDATGTTTFEMSDKNYSTDKDRFSESNVFGDISINASSEKFSGGSVNNVFGDMNIDLTKINLSKELVKVYISGVFGDITIKTPQNLALKISANAVAGDIVTRGERRDGLFPKLNYTTDNYESAEKKLYIQVSIVFGSVNVY